MLNQIKIFKVKDMNHIFVGHYGSGKTEVSINFALNLKKENPDKDIAIIDLDIVNPYYRTADAKEDLKKAGIHVEVPLFANTNVDVPALTAAMGALMENKDKLGVVDVGGDDLGAKAVARYAEEINKGGYVMYFVLNPNRPFTSTLEQAVKMYDEIESSTTLKITGLVNNSNLLQYTDKDVFLEGMEKVLELSRVKKVPVLLNTVFEKTADSLKEEDIKEGRVLVMKEHVSLLWSREDDF
jgi:hypothetical protein